MTAPNTAFQRNAFQFWPDRSFQVDVWPITDTTVLQKPINAILAGQQDYEVGQKIAEEFPENLSASIVAQASERVRLSEPSTFVVKTNNRGYD